MLEYLDPDWLETPFFITVLKEQDWYPPRHLYALDYPWVCKQVFELSGRCLDLGCAIGHLSIYLSEKTNLEMHGLDRDNHSGWWKGKKLKFTPGHFENMSYPDHFFDSIISVSAIEHNVDEAFPAIFKEAKRVLKPKGKFICTLPFDVKTWRRTDHRVFTSDYLNQVLHEVGWDLGEVKGDLTTLKSKWARFPLTAHSPFVEGGVVLEG